MPDGIDAIVRSNLAKILAEPVPPGDLDPTLSMADDYGLTSLNKVLFLTAVCERAAVPLSEFTEEDVAGMRTLNDVIDALTRYAGRVG